MRGCCASRSSANRWYIVQSACVCMCMYTYKYTELHTLNRVRTCIHTYSVFHIWGCRVIFSWYHVYVLWRSILKAPGAQIDFYCGEQPVSKRSSDSPCCRRATLRRGPCSSSVAMNRLGVLLMFNSTFHYVTHYRRLLCVAMFVSLSVHMYPCMSLWVHIHIHIYVDMHTYVYTHICMYVCMYVCMHVCTYVCRHVCSSVCVCIYIYVCIYVCLCLFVHVDGQCVAPSICCFCCRSACWCKQTEDGYIGR